MTSSSFPSEPKPPELAFQPVFVIVSSLVLFTVFWYFGRKPFYYKELHQYLADGTGQFEGLYSFGYFVLSSVVLRMLVPMLCIRLVLKRRLRRPDLARWRLIRCTLDGRLP